MKKSTSKEKIPLGMILLLVLYGWGAFSTLLSLVNPPVFQLGPYLLTGSSAIPLTLITIGVLLAIFYGILKRFKWAWKLTISWQIYVIVLGAINYLSFSANTSLYDDFYEQSLPPESYAMMTPELISISLLVGSIFSIIIGLLVLTYLVKKKPFFTN